MSKIFTIYENAQLIECPDRWIYYKEIESAPLILMESEQKHPGELFFNFCGLRSSFIKELNTEQKTLQSDIIVNIVTKNNKYAFKVRV